MSEQKQFTETQFLVGLLREAAYGVQLENLQVHILNRIETLENERASSKAESIHTANSIDPTSIGYTIAND